ncbi:hypothetical protein SAMN05421740_108101 [Parapedobacter koreensis]|uniref:Uncharacterized protein n=1 Tax=Parapedobacter koreensis TaxID=332977 RepID=A0A1H7S5S6_9SPHI|nr:hypothetical protein SAMN05421740_108101 [Parapedobacter koreensis]
MSYGKSTIWQLDPLFYVENKHIKISYNFFLKSHFKKINILLSLR